MSPAFLNETAYRQFRAMPPNQGVNTTTHTAIVADQAGKEHRCYVKLLPDPTSPRLVCEALGWVLTGAAGLLRPDFGAVLLVPVSKLPDPLRSHSSLAGLATCPSWCASEINPGRQVAHARMGHYDIARERKSLLEAKTSRQIAAFDEWADVADRNLGNVVVTPKKTYHPIDHETLLYDTLWTDKTMARKSLLSMAEQKLDAEKLKRFKVDMCNAAKGHAAALANAQASLQDVIDSMFDPPVNQQKWQQVLGALQTRSEQTWMSDRLKVIA